MLWIGFMLMLITSESHGLDNVKDSQILKYENKNNGLGMYKFSFKTSDYIHREETGEPKYPLSDSSAVIVKGFYSYTGNDGQKQEVHYVADEQGFHPKINTKLNYFKDSSSQDDEESSPRLSRVTGDELVTPSSTPIDSITQPTTHRTTTSKRLFRPILGIGSSAIGSLVGGGLGKK